MSGGGPAGRPAAFPCFATSLQKVAVRGRRCQWPPAELFRRRKWEERENRGRKERGRRRRQREREGGRRKEQKKEKKREWNRQWKERRYDAAHMSVSGWIRILPWTKNDGVFIALGCCLCAGAIYTALKLLVSEQFKPLALLALFCFALLLYMSHRVAPKPASPPLGTSANERPPLEFHRTLNPREAFVFCRPPPLCNDWLLLVSIAAFCLFT
jgi:hypothetical protein